MTARSHMKLTLLALSISALLPLTSKSQDRDPLQIAQRVAERVIADTRFAFRQVPQKEELGMQTIDFRFLGLQAHQTAYARRTFMAARDTVIGLNYAANGKLTVWLNNQLILPPTRHSSSSPVPVEYAYGRFRFTRSISVPIRAGNYELRIAYTNEKARPPLVFLRAQTSLGDLDSTTRFDAASPWLYSTDSSSMSWQPAPTRTLKELVIDNQAVYRRESYADWQYASGILMSSILHLGDASDNDNLHRFVNDYTRFALRNRQYFQQQYDSLFAWRGSYHRMFRQTMLDDAGAPALPFLELLSRRNEDSLKLIRKAAIRYNDDSLKLFQQAVMEYFANRQARLPDGTFCRPEPELSTIWADDLFMSTPVLLRLSRLTGRRQYADDAAAQSIHFRSYLLDTTTGLYHHGWFSLTRKQSAVCWGRANGWIAWAATELLEGLPASHPLYDRILINFQSQMTALLRYQATDGFWCQVLDNPSTYKETSCTAMFALAMAKGIRRHWLDSSFLLPASRAWQAVASRITPDGVVHGICRGTDIGPDRDFYNKRATPDNDPRGLGAVITAAIEMAALFHDAPIAARLPGAPRQTLLPEAPASSGVPSIPASQFLPGTSASPLPPRIPTSQLQPGTSASLLPPGDRLFDMGSDRPTQTGRTRITPADGYTPAKGFGWLKKPERSFDSVNHPLPQSYLKEGVLGRDSMVFKADLPENDYLVSITLGAPPADSLQMTCAINGRNIADTIVTPWFRLAYRTITKKVHPQNGSISVTARSSAGSLVGIYAIAFHTITGTKSLDLPGRLDEDTTLIMQQADKLRKSLAADPGNPSIIHQLQTIDDYLLACRYYAGGGWSWAVHASGMSLIYRLYAAADLLEQNIDPSDPLYDRSLYLLARIYYWLNEEDEVIYHSDKFQGYFAALQKKYPDNQLLRMYLGEKFYTASDIDTVYAYPKTGVTTDPGIQRPSATGTRVPLWARLERETMHRLLGMLHWWTDVRQTANGEMGGKYGDDVELLRWWLPAILGADDSSARAGYLRLANGVWNSGILERGYARQIDDVEHSAELFRDTHPALFLIDYGNPEYLERCLTSMQNFKDVWTGITPIGHRHFRSYYLSATSILDDPEHGIDVAMNARALLPGLWAAWYNHNPAIVSSFSEWCHAWVADAEKTGNGKPAGIVPPAIAFRNDRIGGNSDKWYDANLSYDYYRWDHIGPVCELQDHILGMYDLTKDRSLLKPVENYAAFMRTGSVSKEASAPLALASAGKPAILTPSSASSGQPRPALTPGSASSGQAAPAPTPGSAAWSIQTLRQGGADHDSGDNPMGKVFAMARAITASSRYDAVVAQYSNPYIRYQVTGNRQDIYKGLQVLQEHLRYNFPLLTSEVKFTDRVYMPGSDILCGMYTGHFSACYEYPSLVATWKNTGPDVAVFVHRGSSTAASISLYNFGKQKTVSMYSYRLAPGKYLVQTGIDEQDDGKIVHPLTSDTILLRERVNEISIALPSQKNTLLRIRQLTPLAPVPFNAPDIALTTNDLLFGNTLACRIHNIGNRAADNITVALFVDHKRTEEVHIPAIAAPNDLQPKWQTVRFKWIPQPGRHYIEVRAAIAQKEITTLNNKTSRTIDIPTPKN